MLTDSLVLVLKSSVEKGFGKRTTPAKALFFLPSRERKFSLHLTGLKFSKSYKCALHWTQIRGHSWGET